MPSGGSTGQILTKQSGTDYDATWLDAPAGGGGGGDADGTPARTERVLFNNITNLGNTPVALTTRATGFSSVVFPSGETTTELVRVAASTGSFTVLKAGTYLLDLTGLVQRGTPDNNRVNFQGDIRNRSNEVLGRISGFYQRTVPGAGIDEVLVGYLTTTADNTVVTVRLFTPTSPGGSGTATSAVNFSNGQLNITPLLNVEGTGGGGGTAAPTNLSITRTSNDIIIRSSTGNDATIPPATTSQAGSMSSGDKATLDETLDQAAITAVANAAASRRFTDAEKSKLSGVATGAIGAAAATAIANQRAAARFTDAEKAKLSGIDAAAIDAVEANIIAAAAARLRFTDAEKSKLTGIETAATADQTGAEMVTALSALSGNARLPASAVRDLPSGGGSGEDATARAAAQVNLDSINAMRPRIADNSREFLIIPNEWVRTTDARSFVLHLDAGAFPSGATQIQVTIHGVNVNRQALTADDTDYTVAINASNAGTIARAIRSTTTVLKVEVRYQNASAVTLAEHDFLIPVVSAATPGGITAAERTKLSGVESGAIGPAAVTAIANARAAARYTDAEKTKLSGIATSAINAAAATAIANQRAAARFTDAEKTKLTGIESGATADQTGTEMVTALSGLSGNDRLPASAVRDLPSGGGDVDTRQDVVEFGTGITRLEFTENPAATYGADGSTYRQRYSTVHGTTFIFKSSTAKTVFLADLIFINSEGIRDDIVGSVFYVMNDGTGNVTFGGGGIADIRPTTAQGGATILPGYGAFIFLTPHQSTRFFLQVVAWNRDLPTGAQIVSALSGLSGNARLPATAIRDLPSGGATNITISRGPNSVSVNSSTGSNGTILTATNSIAGVMSAADKAKLDGLGGGGTSNMVVQAWSTAGVSTVTLPTNYATFTRIHIIFSRTISGTRRRWSVILLTESLSTINSVRLSENNAAQWTRTPRTITKQTADINYVELY